MKKILRNCCILLMLPIHAAYILAMWYGPRADYIYGAALLLILLIDFALSAWQMELFTAKRSRIGEFAHDYLPYLLQKLGIIGAEWLILLMIGKGDVFRTDLVLFAGVCFVSATALLSGFVTFLTGAARTMLYHDEKR